MVYLDTNDKSVCLHTKMKRNSCYCAECEMSLQDIINGPSR